MRVRLTFAGLILLSACSVHSAPGVASPNDTAAIPHANAARGGRHPSLAGFKIPEGAASAVQPLSLTASDGSGLSIQSLEIKSRIFGAIAETTMRVGFQNPSPGRREGRFRVGLPPRSSLTRLAMKIDGTWREADAAEISAARTTYETIEHRQRDPLLVEQRREREIAARVFPIEPWETKEIIVSYSSEVQDDLPFVVPLAGLPRIGKLDVSVMEGSPAKPRFSLHTEDQKPIGDVRIAPREGQGARATRAGELVMVHHASSPANPDPIDAPILFIVETSATQLGSLERTAELLTSVAASLGPGSTRAAVVAYDQTSERIYDGTLAGVAASKSAISSSLALRGALGASDLENALVVAASEAKRINARRIIFLGGGTPTSGSADPKRLRALAEELASPSVGVERLDLLGTNTLSDARVYRPLLSLFARPGAVVEDAPLRSIGYVTSRLTHSVVDAAITIPGATWTRRASDNTILATIPKSVPFLKARIGKELVDLPADEAPVALLEHSFATAKVDALVARGERDGFTDAIKKEILALARKNRLATPFTALLVLESEADRKLLRSIENEGEAQVKPIPNPPPPSPPPAPPTAPVAQPAAGSPSRIAGAHVSKAVTLRVASVQVNGRIPPEVVQRTVRMRFGRLRACYEDGLRRRGPQLGGRVVIKFVIDPRGTVVFSEDAGSEIGDAKVIQCIVDDFKQMQFPHLDNSTITVVYPLLLQPEQDDTRPSSHLPVFGTMGMSALPRWWGGGATTPDLTPPPVPAQPTPWTPEYGHVMQLLPYANNDPRAPILAAADLRVRAPSPIAWVALGQAFEAAGDRERAARAYGSVADLYPERAEMLRAAAVRIDAISGKGDHTALALLHRAVDDRPDQPTSHHLLALTLLRAGRHEEAFDAIVNGLRRSYPARYHSVNAALRADLGMIAASWAEARPDLRSRIEARGSAYITAIPNVPLVRASLIWETDTSDLDVILQDRNGASPTQETLANMTDGFGLDIVELTDPNYDTSIHASVLFHRRGEGGDVLGAVHIVKHDGRGHVVVEPRPFAMMNTNTSLSLGDVLRTVDDR